MSGADERSALTPLPWGLLRPYVRRAGTLLVLIFSGALVEAVGLLLLAGLLAVFLGATSAGQSSALVAPLYGMARSNPALFLLLLVGVYLVKSVLAIAGTYGSFSLAL